MNAIPKEFLHEAVQGKIASIQSFQNSEKVYVQGSRADLKVPMRKVSQSATPAAMGAEENPPVYVYDTSGPFTDPAVRVDLRFGLNPLREAWIDERGDSERLPGPSSDFGRQRQTDPELAHLRFEHIRTPRRARAGANVTQMHYARRGIVTPEMERAAARSSRRTSIIRNRSR